MRDTESNSNPNPNPNSDEPKESTPDHAVSDPRTKTPPSTSRRAVLAAVGAGMVAGSGAFAIGASGAERESIDRRYLECSRPTIDREAFPEAVQAEFDEALESGRYESNRPPRVLETIDIEESHVRLDGTVYTAVVDETADGTYVLTLHVETIPTLGEPRTLDIRNRSGESRTLMVQIESPAGSETGDEAVELESEVLYDGAVEIDAGERRTVWGTNAIGTYDLTIETEDGEHVEDGFYVTEGGFTSVEIGEDGGVGVLQAQAGLAECEFDPEAYSSPWVDLEVESEHLEPGERTTAALFLTYTTKGVSEYDLEVTVDDANVVRITDVQYDEAFDAGDAPGIAADGSAATLRAVDTTEAVPSAARFVPLATVELEATDGVADGEEFGTRVDVAVESMSDDDGSPVDANGESTSFTVARPLEWGTGVDRYAYSRDSRGLDQGERDLPLVTIGNDAVVVHGSSTTGPSVCSADELLELAFDETEGTLMASVSGPNDPEHDAGDCTDDVAAVSYELVATLEEGIGPAETVRLTERAYARSGTSVVTRDDARPAVRGVDDYEFSLVDREFGNPEAADHDPEVSVEGGTVVVAGTIELPYVACQTVEPALIAYDEERGRLVVEVTKTWADGVDPGDPCPAEAGFQGYELRVPVDGGVDTLRRVSAVEPTVDGTRLVTVDGRDLESSAEIELNGYTPRDLNGDGLYRDVDGNGELGTNDVVTLFDHLEHEAVTANPEAFDFAGTGEVTTTDVVELFEEL
ncbi:hypothetical protein [Natronoglomus mannanivorans]|uniref:Dockerin domain-containing protein n=1 Tax=Natronoglomus mannanivorans TaxID=2979990 RepID=A0AAP2YX58_9EURY|nr:hypothetical protein [Halobacteria archaeon AArc-xg1-1]